MNPHWNDPLPSVPSRRDLLRRAGAGFGALALAGLLGEEARAAGANALVRTPAAGPDPRRPLAPRPPHFPARARRVIFLFMHGGPVAGRHVRLQAAARARPRQAAAVRQAAGGVERDGQPARLPLEVSPVTARAAPWVSELFPARRPDASTTCASSTACTAPTRARRRPARAAHRQRHVRPPQHGLVDHLRPGDREPEPAGLHHHLPDADATAASTTSARPSCRPSTRERHRQTGVPDRAGQVPVHREHDHARGTSSACRARPAQEMNRDHLDRDRPRPGPRRPHRLVRAGLPHADHGPRGAGHLRRDGGDAATLRPGRRGHAPTSASSACWPGALPSAACASCRRRTATSGTSTATSRRTTPTTLPRSTGRSPACSRT